MLLVLFSAASCNRQRPIPAPTAALPAATPVVETRIVERTVTVERTVVVTAAPTPTPFYTSRITAPAGTLVYPLPADPVSLDPQEAADENARLILGQIYEGLFEVGADGSVLPAAASGYDVSPDGRVYTIHLRPGLTWSDDRPVTAQDYASGACRLLDPTLGSSFAYLLTDAAAITGTRAYAAGAAPDCSAAGIQAADPLTLRLTLEHAAPALPQILASPAFMPGPPGAAPQSAAPAGAGMGAPASGTPARVPGGIGAPAGPTPSRVTALQPGNGPYVLAEWTPGDHLTLVKNPRYWNSAAVAVERIELPIVPDAAARLAGFESGRYHVADFPPAAAARILADAGLRRELRAVPQPGTSFLGFNTAAGPGANPAFRSAVASAIDRKTLVERVLQEPWRRPAASVLPPGLPNVATPASPPYLYDPQAARAFLAKAGYSPQDPPPISIWANREGHNAALAQAIAGMLEEAGIPTRLTLSTWPVLHDALGRCRGEAAAAAAAARCDYTLYLAGWVMDYGDPARMLGEALGVHPVTEYSGWRSEEYATLLARAGMERDADRRGNLYGQAEKLLLDQAVVIPLFYYDRALLIKEGVAFGYPLFGPPRFSTWRLPGQ